MRSSEPMCRAHIAKDMLSVVRSSQEAPEVLSKLPPTLISQLDGATPLTWVPATSLTQVVDTMAQVLSSQQFSSLILGTATKTVENSAAKSLLSMTIRMFGLNPRSLIKIMPTLWELQWKNAGGLKYQEINKAESHLVWHQIPTPCLSRAMLLGFAAGFHVLYNYCQMKGHVLSASDERAQTATFKFHWS